MPGMTDETRGGVLQFWAAMQANDWAAAAALFADDYVLDWPQSGERIRSHQLRRGQHQLRSRQAQGAMMSVEVAFLNPERLSRPPGYSAS